MKEERETPPRGRAGGVGVETDGDGGGDGDGEVGWCLVRGTSLTMVLELEHYLLLLVFGLFFYPCKWCPFY